MARNQIKKVDLSDGAVKQILGILLGEFRERGLGANNLHEGYEGIAPATLKTSCCANGRVSEVDFDLAMKNLLEADLVKTGPIEMYDNPDPSIVMIAFYSKNEFSYLTEAGYQAANKVGAIKPPRPPAATTVHISGSTFHNSPVGVGHHIAQEINLTTANTDQLIERLRMEVQQHIPDDAKRGNVITKLDALQAAHDQPTRLDRYTQLMGVIGDHITVLTFVLTPLLQSLMR